MTAKIQKEVLVSGMTVFSPEKEILNAWVKDGSSMMFYYKNKDGSTTNVSNDFEYAANLLLKMMVKDYKFESGKFNFVDAHFSDADKKVIFKLKIEGSQLGKNKGQSDLDGDFELIGDFLSVTYGKEQSFQMLITMAKLPHKNFKYQLNNSVVLSPPPKDSKNVIN